MTRQQIACLEVAELERWYALPSPAVAPSTTLPALLGVWVACALLVAVIGAPRG